MKVANPRQESEGAKMFSLFCIFVYYNKHKYKTINYFNRISILITFKCLLLFNIYVY